MLVHIFDQQKDLNINHSRVKTVVKQVLALEGASCHEVSIHFVDTQAISKLHAKFFDDPSPTDCITFPIDTDEGEEYRVLGEVFVCPKTALNYTLDNQGDPYFETTLYLVHGLLHLLEYDDQGEKEKAMRLAEKRHMEHLESLNMLLDKN